MTVGAGMMVMERAFAGEIAPVLSFTVTLKLNGLPDDDSGIPLIKPVAESSVKPGGRVPVDIVHTLCGGVPPLAASGVEYGTPTFPVGRLVVVMTNAAAAGEMVSANETVALPPRASVTVNCGV